MKKIELTDEELEMMNYNDVAFVILQENGKKMKIIDLMNEVSALLKLDEATAQSHLTDFFELLSTDKRFVMLDDGYWDLRVKHDKGMVIDEDEEDDDELIIEDDSDATDEDNYDDGDSKGTDDDIEDDDLSDLVIIDDGDDENNM